MNRKTIPELLRWSLEGRRLTMLTAYDASFARILDAAGIDMILVGDSLGMVIQGHENTLPVTLEEVLYHTCCVTRVVRNAHVTADMPFLSYQVSREEALRHAGRLLKEGKAQSVKMEGGEELAETVLACVRSGIPVMGHIGLRPQQIHHLGGYKIQGKSISEADHLVKEALVLEEAGCFMLVLEGIALETAAAVTNAVKVPTIGIASGPHCKGQVLVLQDLLGMDASFQPRHAKAYVNLHAIVGEAVRKYMEEVQQGKFPAEEHTVHRNVTALARESSK